MPIVTIKLQHDLLFEPRAPTGPGRYENVDCEENPHSSLRRLQIEINVQMNLMSQ